MIHRIELAKDFVFYTSEEGAKLFEDAVGYQLINLVDNKEKVFNDSMVYLTRAKNQDISLLGRIEEAINKVEKMNSDKFINKRLSKRRK